MRFSANLRFLWADLPLPVAIRAAKDAGFDAVECHWPYGTPAPAVRAALDETGLEMLGLNTQRGPPGENGLAALPGRAQDARAAIEEAVHYAIATRSRSVHVMAGFAAGPVAHAAFVDNLRFACAMAQRSGISILIEPLNRHDAPGYFLKTTDQARDIILQIAAPNLRGCSIAIMCKGPKSMLPTGWWICSRSLDISSLRLCLTVVRRIRGS